MNWCEPVSVRTVTWSPTSKSSRSAVALSTATWSGPLGGWPSPLISMPDSEASPVQAVPNVGAPPVLTASPSASTNWA